MRDPAAAGRRPAGPPRTVIVGYTVLAFALVFVQILLFG